MVRERHRVIASLLALAAIVALVVVRVVSGHGELETATPRPDSVVTQAPQQVTARFSEELDPDGSTLRVVGPDGEPVDLGDGAPDLNDPDRTSMVVTLPEGLGPGTYTVEWVTVSSEDGHSEQGSFAFTVDPDAPQDPAQATPALVPPDGTPEPLPTTEVDDDGGVGRGALILGAVAVLIAVIVIVTAGGRRA